jgi:DNA ligase-1
MINFPLYPMLLNKADAVPTGSNYLHQLKIDGIRCLMHYSPSGIKLSSRHLTDMTRQFPEITSLKLNATDTILDGELCVLDEQSNQPSFEKTMTRFQASGAKVGQYAKSLPATYFAFDILQLNGDGSLIHKPLTERLKILKEVMVPTDHLVMLESYEDGQALFGATKNMGLEGIVSKPKDSPYLLGKRALWLKNKHFMIDTVEVIGIRKGDFAWMLAQDGKYIGLTELVPTNARNAFWHVAKQIIKNEDKNFIYLEPYFSIKVKSIGRTSKGYLRTPSFVEFVLDKPAG